VQRFRGGLVFKAHRLCVSLNSRLESNKEEEELRPPLPGPIKTQREFVVNTFSGTPDPTPLPLVETGVCLKIEMLPVGGLVAFPSCLLSLQVLEGP